MLPAKHATKHVQTPFDEGFDAGYKGEKRFLNPYLRGWTRTSPVFYVDYVVEWFAGFDAGVDAAKTDLVEKHRESAR